MENIVLQAKTRTILGKKVEALREQKLIPAVVYGVGDSQSITLEYVPFEKAFRQSGESTLVDLVVDSGKPVKVLVHDVQREPIRSRITHVDFYQVKMDQKLTLNIPLKFIGEAKAVKELGGILVKQLDEVEVRCLPGDLVHEIEVDMSNLATFEDSIRFSDVHLPKGIELVSDSQAIVALVMPPVSEAELAAMEQQSTADVSTIEVVGKGKKEEEVAEAEK